MVDFGLGRRKGGRGRASTHEAFGGWVRNRQKKGFLSFLGPGGGVPGRGAEGEGVGVGGPGRLVGGW